MQDKLEKVREFIQANPGRSNRWYADNNGLLKRATFYKYLNDIIMDRSMDRSMDTPTDNMDNLMDNESASATPTSEIIQNLFEEHEKNETRKLKNRQYNYNAKIKKTLEELQKENEELKSKFEELQSKYEQLQTDLIFERQLKEKYENQIHDLPYKQSEFNELKNKYEKLQLDYFALKNGKEVKKDESNEKTKEEKSQWWEEI